MNWHWTRLSDEIADDVVIAAEIDSVFKDGFKCAQGWGAERIHNRLYAADILGILRTASGFAVGYAIYSSSTDPLDGTFVLWEDSICLRKDYQCSNQSPKASILLPYLSSILRRKFGWFGGATQNPIIYKRVIAHPWHEGGCGVT
jgi:hypothetical protein